jgi:L-lactate utilization protein LutC
VFQILYSVFEFVQGITHCSVEDAVTALALYKKYLEMKESDTLIEALNELYEHGKQYNWKTPEQTEEEEMVLQQIQQQQQQMQQQQQKMPSIRLKGKLA